MQHADFRHTIRCWLMLVFSIAVMFQGQAQQGLVTYGNRDHSWLNPAFLNPLPETAIAVFPASAFAFSFESPFSLYSITTLLPDGQKAIDLSKMELQAGKRSLFLLDAALDYFSYSSTIGKHQWQIRLSEQLQAGIQADQALFTMLNRGNVHYMDEWFETRMPLGLIQYTTFSATSVRQINEQLKIGFSGKLYFGKAYAQAAPEIRLYTANDAEYLITEIEGKVKASLPLNRNINPLGHVNGWALQQDFSLARYLFQMKNPGFGVDFGFDYQHNEQWNFSAALIDLGWIAWLGNRNSLDLSGSTRWDGVDISYIAASKFIEKQGQGISLADSFIFNNIDPVKEGFLSLTPLRIHLSAQFIQSEKISINAVNQLIYFNKILKLNTTLALNLTVNEQWQMNTGLRLLPNGFPALPVGIAYNGNRIKMTASLHNLWGTLVPSRNRLIGGSISLSYRFNYIPLLPSFRNYPFYQPYQNK
jgi:hypothetical protein